MRYIYMAGNTKKQFPDYFPSTALRLNQVRAKLLEMYGGKRRKSGKRGVTPLIAPLAPKHAAEVQVFPTTRQMHRRVPSMPTLERDSQGAITEWKQKYWSERKSSRKALRLTQPVKSEKPQILDLKKPKRAFLRAECEGFPQPPHNSALLSPLPSPQPLGGHDLSSLLSPIGNKQESLLE